VPPPPTPSDRSQIESNRIAGPLPASSTGTAVGHGRRDGLPIAVESSETAARHRDGEREEDGASRRSSRTNRGGAADLCSVAPLLPSTASSLGAAISARAAAQELCAAPPPPTPSDRIQIESNRIESRDLCLLLPPRRPLGTGVGTSSPSMLNRCDASMRRATARRGHGCRRALAHHRPHDRATAPPPPRCLASVAAPPPPRRLPCSRGVAPAPPSSAAAQRAPR
jgi:hypothetical protein